MLYTLALSNVHTRLVFRSSKRNPSVTSAVGRSASEERALDSFLEGGEEGMLASGIDTVLNMGLGGAKAEKAGEGGVGLWCVYLLCLDYRGGARIRLGLLARGVNRWWIGRSLGDGGRCLPLGL